MPQRQVDGHTTEGEFRLLSEIDLFRPLEPKEIRHIVAALDRRVILAGNILVNLGERGESLFILIEGLLDVEVMQDGIERHIAQIQPGQIIGEMSLLTGERRSATVRARCESVVYEVSKDPLLKIMHDRPALAHDLSRVLAQRQMMTQLALEDHPADETQAELDTFARHLLGKMREFLFSPRLHSQN